MGVHGTGVPLASLFKPPVLGPHRPCFVTLSSSCSVWENWHGSCPDGMASAASTAHSSSQKTQLDYFYIAMSSAAAGVERDAAEGAAAAHVPGMDDRIAALKAERQALKRQLKQTSREVKAQAGSISSLCAMFVLVKLYWHSIVPLAPSSFPSQVFFPEAALHLHRTTGTFNLFVSALRQEKKRRRVLKSAGKLSTQDLSWLLALKMTRQQ